MMRTNQVKAATSAIPATAVEDEPSSAQGAPTRSLLEGIAEELVEVYIVRITPALARAWLGANISNRTLRPMHCKRLASVMAGGRWRLTHQGVAFSSKGRLIDGQHRLKAIILSGVPVLMMVFIELEDGMFGALDRGKTRSTVDDMGRERSMIEPCNWIARVFNKDGYTSPFVVRELFDIYHMELEAIVAAAAGNAKARSSSPVRAALMIRLKDATPEGRVLLLDQWAAFLRLKVDQMDRTTGSMLRRLENTKGSYEVERGCIGWVGWNPASRDLSKVLIRDISTTMSELRAVVTRHRAENALWSAEDPEWSEDEAI